MKKSFLLLLTAILALNLLTGCATTKTKTETKTDDTKQNETETKPDTNTNTNTTNTGKVKTGFAVLSSIASSKDASLAQVDSNAAAVLVGADGKIVKCVIDGVQSKTSFDNTGKITTPLDTTYPTKVELGEKYGMKKASAIGKEWSEEIQAFANYVTGKTVAEVKGIAINDKGHATGADLSSSVTISIADYIKLVEKAVTNATVDGASASDKLGLGIVTNIAKSANAGDTAGKVEAYSTYTVVTTDASGKITSSIIDASQTDVSFDKTGKITSDLKADLKTKNEIGAAYGMKKASAIGKEWNEEAQAFAKYITGKTAAEVATIAVNEKKEATGSDLTSSVTISIGDFQECVKKAAATAK